MKQNASWLVSRSTSRTYLFRSDKISGVKSTSSVRAVQHDFSCLAYAPCIPRNMVGPDPDIRLPKGHRLTECSRQGTAVPWTALESKALWPRLFSSSTAAVPCRCRGTRISRTFDEQLEFRAEPKLDTRVHRFKSAREETNPIAKSVGNNSSSSQTSEANFLGKNTQ